MYRSNIYSKKLNQYYMFTFLFLQKNLPEIDDFTQKLGTSKVSSITNDR